MVRRPGRRTGTAPAAARDRQHGRDRSGHRELADTGGEFVANSRHGRRASEKLQAAQHDPWTIDALSRPSPRPPWAGTRYVASPTGQSEKPRPSGQGGATCLPALAYNVLSCEAKVASRVVCRSGNFVCASPRGRAPSITRPHTGQGWMISGAAQHHEQREASGVRSPRARPKRRARRAGGRRDVRAGGLGRAVRGAGAVLERRAQSAARRYRR